MNKLWDEPVQFWKSRWILVKIDVKLTKVQNFWQKFFSSWLTFLICFQNGFIIHNQLYPLCNQFLRQQLTISSKLPKIRIVQILMALGLMVNWFRLSTSEFWTVVLGSIKKLNIVKKKLQATSRIHNVRKKSWIFQKSFHFRWKVGLILETRKW